MLPCLLMMLMMKYTRKVAQNSMSSSSLVNTLARPITTTLSQRYGLIELFLSTGSILSHLTSGDSVFKNSEILLNMTVSGLIWMSQLLLDMVRLNLKMLNLLFHQPRKHLSLMAKLLTGTMNSQTRMKSALSKFHSFLDMFLQMMDTPLHSQETLITWHSHWTQPFQVSMKYHTMFTVYMVSWWPRELTST